MNVLQWRSVLDCCVCGWIHVRVLHCGCPLSLREVLGGGIIPPSLVQILGFRSQANIGKCWANWYGPEARGHEEVLRRRLLLPEVLPLGRAGYDSGPLIPRLSQSTYHIRVVCRCKNVTYHHLKSITVKWLAIKYQTPRVSKCCAPDQDETKSAQADLHRAHLATDSRKMLIIVLRGVGS